MNFLYYWLFSVVAVFAFYGIARFRCESSPRKWPIVLEGPIVAVLSFLLALIVGFLVYEAQTADTAKADKERYLKLLAEEVGLVERQLNWPDTAYIVNDNTGDTLKALLVYLPCLVLEDAGRSGLFPESRSYNLLASATFIRQYNLHSQFLVSVLSTAGHEGNIESAVKQLNGSAEHVRGQIKATKNQMNLSPSTMAEALSEGEEAAKNK